LKFEISVSEYLTAQMRRASINIDLKGDTAMWAKASALGLFAIALASLPSNELSAQSALEQAKKTQSQSSNATRSSNTTERSSGQARGGDDTQSGQRTNRSETESGRPADPVHGQQPRLQAGRAEHADQRAARAIESQPPV
jgi:hypothetical protein